jgi:spoIIIJ-associated protein
MGKERTTLEVIAPSVEEAVAKGLSDLGLPEEAVEVEVLDSGTRGFLGLGTRQSRVRLTVLEQPANQEKKPESDAEGTVDVEGDDEQVPVSLFAPRVDLNVENEEEDDTLRSARETVSLLLEKMKVYARVTARYGENDDANSEAPILVDIHGDDLSILIGRKSETLNALQYLSSLIVGKELGRWVSLQLDVEGYRARRERVLKQLARRMADQAVYTGKRQVLEPMPANERRVIHMELRDHPAVTTESTGEEPNRKVTIILKK